MPTPGIGSQGFISWANRAKYTGRARGSMLLRAQILSTTRPPSSSNSAYLSWTDFFFKNLNARPTISTSLLSSTALVGTVTVTIGVNTIVLGNSGTLSTTAPTVTGTAVVSITGNNATLSTTAPTVTTDSSVNISVSVTGNNATLSTTAPTVTGTAVVSVTGNNATLSTTAPTVTGTAVISVTGNNSTLSTTAPTVTGTAVISVTGNNATLSTTAPTVTGTAVVSVTGNNATLSTIAPTVTGTAVISLTGNYLTTYTNDIQFPDVLVTISPPDAISTTFGTVTVTTTGSQPSLSSEGIIQSPASDIFTVDSFILPRTGRGKIRLKPRLRVTGLGSHRVEENKAYIKAKLPIKITSEAKYYPYVLIGKTKLNVNVFSSGIFGLSKGSSSIRSGIKLQSKGTFLTPIHLNNQKIIKTLMALGEL